VSNETRRKTAALIVGVLLMVVGVGCSSSPDGELPEPAGVEDAQAAEEANRETATEGETDREAQGQESVSAAPRPPKPRVARVIDGDTLELDDGSRVRLVQIDAPESDGECYGRKAGTVLRKLLPVGTAVRLQRDRRLDNRDRYERLLRYVFKGRQNVNLLLVQRGAASVWYYQGDRGRYADELLRAAESAQANERGAWGACGAELTPESAFDTRHLAKERQPVDDPDGPNCHPSYAGACLDPSSPDYDCAGGEGDGPDYTGPVRVVGPDDYGLDNDGTASRARAASSSSHLGVLPGRGSGPPASVRAGSYSVRAVEFRWRND
jgi:endonuclease YncB( thermonuclease family)